MFRLFTSVLTAGTVLWHAVAGCCTHHDHATHEQHEHDVACATAESHADESHHDDDCEHHDEAPASEPAAPCDEAECSFVAATWSSPVELLGKHLLVSSVADDVAAVLVEPHAVDGYAPEVAVRPPPLRVHLALGILLI